jgi:L-alanine-DL-glutamate epimerase-like enolase superfamily enzyme
MRITEIDVIPIEPRLAARYVGREPWYDRINHRTIYRVRADNGLVGYGDHRLGVPSRASLQPLIGCDPFEFVGNDFDPGLGGALYDLMGKSLDVPAYRLMGPKVRDAISVAAWTSRASAQDFGQEVIRAAQQGYGVIKMHTAPFFDVLEQTRCAEEGAPPDFRLHYDFNGSRTLATALPLVRRLEEHPIVGFIEDPFPKADRDAWCRLRAQSQIPLIFHVSAAHAPLPEVTAGVADTYLFSGVSIGRTLTGGAACACANTQVLLQLTGGTLTKALALHMAAVLPTATGHSIHLDDQYEDDVTVTRLPVVAGSSRVPDGPGLGVEVDEDALARLAERAAAPRKPPPRCVGILRLPGEHSWYTALPPDVVRLTGREEGNLRGIGLDLWWEDGSELFERIHGQVARDGAVEADPSAS